MTIRAATAALSTLLLLAGAQTARAQYQDWEAAEDSSDSQDAVQGVSLSGPGGDVPPEEEAALGDEPRDETAEEPTDDDEGEGSGLAGTAVLWAEVATFVGSFDVDGAARIDGVHTSPMLGGSYYFTDEIRANAELGMALWFHDEYLLAAGGTTPEDGGVAFRFGNALLSADLVGDRSADLRHRVGVGLTLPLATSNDAAERGALLLALAERGGWDPWMWAAERLSIVATGQLEANLTDQLVVAGDAGVAVLFHAGDGSGDTVLAAQLAGNLEYRMGAVALGGRLTGVLADDLLPERKDFQLAVMPYGRLALGEATFVTLGFELNLIAPFGFSFQEGDAWGLRVGLGTAL